MTRGHACSGNSRPAARPVRCCWRARSGVPGPGVSWEGFRHTAGMWEASQPVLAPAYLEYGDCGCCRMFEQAAQYDGPACARQQASRQYWWQCTPVTEGPSGRCPVKGQSYRPLLVGPEAGWGLLQWDICLTTGWSKMLCCCRCSALCTGVGQLPDAVLSEVAVGV